MPGLQEEDVPKSSLGCVVRLKSFVCFMDPLLWQEVDESRCALVPGP